MRIIALTTQSIGGLADVRTELPLGSVAALAGSNGSGKSKFLACLLSAWSQVLPQPPSVAAAATVEFELTEADWAALQAISDAGAWGEVPRAPRLTMATSFEPMIGQRRVSTPEHPVFGHAFTSPEVHRHHPRFSVVYLPAERRLLAPSASGIDLTQLDELIAMQKTAEPRNAVQNYGRLDDQEFEQFAKALCVAASLPSEGNEDAPATRIPWDRFLRVVNELISPKELLGLSREHPESLRIRTSSGAVHGVQDLSSGERQALIIVSRVLRAGAGHTTVLIDEPDAYLHPHLSRRLSRTLEDGVGGSGQLIVATHSPSVLDGLPPESIVRFSHDSPPAIVGDEPERVDLYRNAGFRASALTQSDLLVVLEGEDDVALMTLLFPELARAAVRAAGGRKQVLEQLLVLAPLEVPVIGAVDLDVLAELPPAEITERVVVWPTADLEGALLSDSAVLQQMNEAGFMKPELTADDQARLLGDLLQRQEENVVAEIAQRRLRDESSENWPTPRGTEAVTRLEAVVHARTPLTAEQVRAAITEARAQWESAADDRWSLVRGKRVLPTFTKEATVFQNGHRLLEATARLGVRPVALDGFRELLDSELS